MTLSLSLSRPVGLPRWLFCVRVRVRAWAQPATSALMQFTDAPMVMRHRRAAPATATKPGRPEVLLMHVHKSFAAAWAANTAPKQRYNT